VWDTLWVLLLVDSVEKVPPLWEHYFGSVLASVSPKTGGWTKDFFVEVFMTDSTLGVYSNFLVVPGEEPSPISASFSLGALDKHLVVGFLGGILPTART
jgi:hypothetical protein